MNSQHLVNSGILIITRMPELAENTGKDQTCS